MTAKSPFPAALIIPALNEEPVIARTLRAIPPGLFDIVIVADNGSTDRTAQIARDLGACVTVEPRRGYGWTCLRALRAVPEGTEAVVFMQADLSEDPREAERLLEPLRSRTADLVLGDRTAQASEPGALLPHQRFGNAIAASMIRLFYSHRYADLGPFRAIRMSALNSLEMRPSKYAWTVEMQVSALEQSLRVVEVPVSYRKRVAGVNKISGQWKASVHAGAVILSTIVRVWASHRLSALGLRPTCAARNRV